MEGCRTLDEFLEDPKDWPSSEYVNFPGVAELYLRKSCIFIDGEKETNVATIANITTEPRGQGNLRRLIEHLKNRGKNIYVESVINGLLAQALEHMGFVRVNQHHGTLNYYLPIRKEEQNASANEAAKQA